MAKTVTNRMKVTFPSLSENEHFARALISGFIASQDPLASELREVITAVSEAVTNCTVHAYREEIGEIELSAKIYEDRTVYIKIKDRGIGITDIEQAMTPLFTTLAQEERSGLGFSVMESFCDSVKVTSKPQKGTTVVLVKKLRTKIQR